MQSITGFVLTTQTLVPTAEAEYSLSTERAVTAKVMHTLVGGDMAVVHEHKGVPPFAVSASIGKVYQLMLALWIRTCTAYDG